MHTYNYYNSDLKKNCHDEHSGPRQLHDRCKHREVNNSNQKQNVNQSYKVIQQNDYHSNLLKYL